ncbi:type I restriction-modification system endonuclease [Chitinibacter bivalviorum]|uniref:Type I restriction-modification system endonuclease n=1 Tax=Chitinibacter bivalviorum TaxID=2739434 RepID=A0A7H9BGB8_9NEIS|nr:type I restriction-modification system endonuclease [Chitinibacter bivalviorum]QLG87625.1 type I restriction-modification system endonuclease [Chitinibacter bivalviorum]
MSSTSNFGFLAEHSSLLVQLVSTAEQVFASDPNTTLIKLRQFGEALAQDLAVRYGVEFDDKTTQSDLLYKLNRELEPEIRTLFHTLRIEGNRATHEFQTQHKEAMEGLKVARVLAIWYHQSFGKQGAAFKAGPFVAPADPSGELRELQKQIEQLRGQLTDTQQALDTNQQLADLIAQEKEQYAVLASQMDIEARTFEAMAAEHEAKLASAQKEFAAQIETLQQQINKDTANQTRKKTSAATKQIVLSEELTRIIIDQQLNEAGWEADSQTLTYAAGARPERNKNKAIAEWPCAGKQSADYVLFAGLTPIAVVEAKRENENVAGKIGQAERYSHNFRIDAQHKPAWELAGHSAAWVDGSHEGQKGLFHIPFVYSSNGRPYFKQLQEQSGTWFRDVRHPANLARALMHFHAPDQLLDFLKRSREDAEAKLKAEGFAYLKVRDYQQKAIECVEIALANNQRNILLAMATGTGKTRTIIGLIYRFLKAERFRRILFLVDRTALGDQALDAFNEAPLEQGLPLSKAYNIADLGDMAAEAETRVQVATVQAMVRRIFDADSPPLVGEYDCIIVDDAHRGYTLDQEMTEGEQAVRDQAQYLSRYRQVLDYFDAVKIGLTATPAKHTSDIFGKPVYTYSYREAVADDWLIDHEPPIRYETKLSKAGISFAKGEAVSVVDTRTGVIDVAELNDEVSFEVESFNRRVITEDFNRVICEELAKEIDPLGDEKTMIFCATDAHADMVKRLLDTAFKNLYGDEYNAAAVQKITGKTDKVSQMIKQYKNERYPSIAITVDLLTTGIDVPKICHLVFMRRVRSRILYEQMIGRATRRCDDIGKTEFKIYDPVDIYAALEDVNTMKPLVKNPDITLAQLLDELDNPDSYTTPAEQQPTTEGAEPSPASKTHADDVLAAVSQKVMRVLRKAEKKAEKNPALKEKLSELEQQWGVEPAKMHEHLRKLGPKAAADFIHHHTRLLDQLSEVGVLIGTEYRPLIAHHKDELLLREQIYGKYDKPADYLESFADFIQRSLNQSAALSLVVNRPKDLTRAQLKEIRMLLDENGFTESTLKTAWRNATNQEIAASIIGYIRRAAIGEALLPFEQRVANAMQKIYALHNWNPIQRKWLDRIAKQLTHEVVIDRDFVNHAFGKDGGAQQLEKILDNQLPIVLETLADELWQASEPQAA